MARNDKSLPLRELVLALLFSLMLCAPLALVMVQKLNIEVPECVISPETKYLEGGIEQSNIREHFSVDGFAQKSLQNEIEVFVGNHVPMKQVALLGNAAIQRTAIEASNRLFQWGCYPTFYGSQRVYVPVENALAMMPLKERKQSLEKLRVFANNLAEFGKLNPRIEFVVLLADMSTRSEANPAFGLVSGSASTAECAEELKDAISRAGGGVHLVWEAYRDPSAYYKHYYRSDHHWNGHGALALYQKAAEELGLTADVLDSEHDDLLQDVYQNGSYSRSGLMLLNESVSEPALRLSGFDVKGGYKLPEMFDRLPLTAENEGLATEFNFYHSWYGASSDATILNAERSGKALVVGDSFSSAAQWMIAANYGQTDVFLDCHDSAARNLSLYDRLSGNSYDAVYFVANPSGLINLVNKSPQYFEE